MHSEIISPTLQIVCKTLNASVLYLKRKLTKFCYMKVPRLQYIQCKN